MGVFGKGSMISPGGDTITPLDNSGPVVACPHTADEYEAKFQAAEVKPEKLSELKSICGKILMNKSRYADVEAVTGVPWYIVACIHSLEASLDFGTFLQNGDPLFDHKGNPLKTTHVPKGVGPFSSWQEAAIHALGGAGAHAPRRLGYWLGYLETYNGTGYRRRGIPSPYLWSYTDQYARGKYVEDGVFDPSAVSDQAGAAAILKVLDVV